jgi:hypothetical protein
MVPESLRIDQLGVDEELPIERLSPRFVICKRQIARIRCDQRVVDPPGIISVRAERIILGIRYDAGPDGIQFDVLPALNEIPFGIDEEALEAALKEMPDVFMVVPVQGIISQENLFEEPGEIGASIQANN